VKQEEEAAAIMGERMGDKHALDLVGENSQYNGSLPAQVKSEGTGKVTEL